ncbi:MAG: hypothetical protein HYZ57_20665 [Acidobacteria bacterium]|nr:hypothetical protein [Acidobacteriota bacterium]
MSWRKVLLPAAVTVAVLAGFLVYRAAGHEECTACRRPVSERTATFATIGGDKVLFCCPACLNSHSRQTGNDVNVVSLTDYASGAMISPASAYIVHGSDVNYCARGPVRVDEHKHALDSHYDRCAPSAIAFASAAAAARFVQDHGGHIMAFSNYALKTGSRARTVR